jgi:hypothetical protein
MSNKKITINQFESDLIKFINNHKYIEQEQSTPQLDFNPGEDRTDISLHTVNGEYERINITINKIS